jgi:PadR family transcriptional regulator PadR
MDITAVRRGVIGPCVLALLDDGPRYGLEIVRELDAAGQLMTSQGTVYPLLNRLRDAGLVSSRWEVAEGERPRRYYELTRAGRRELTEFRHEWEQFSRAVSAVMQSAPEVPDVAPAAKEAAR